MRHRHEHFLICKTDYRRAVKYLIDAAQLYDDQQGQKYESRAYYIRRLVNKLNKILPYEKE